MDGGVVVDRHLGTPQGRPLSPLLANVLLDEVDKALEARGLCFARYADDCNVYVGSIKAGKRVMVLQGSHPATHTPLRRAQHGASGGKS